MGRKMKYSPHQHMLMSGMQATLGTVGLLPEVSIKLMEALHL